MMRAWTRVRILLGAVSAVLTVGFVLGPQDCLGEGVDLLVVSAHPDDEGIFLGAALPYYSQVQQRSVAHVSTTSGLFAGMFGPPDWEREVELTNADTVYFGRPVTVSTGPSPNHDADLFFPRFDVDGWGAAVDTLATHIRVLQPAVIITHDFDGEYGHFDHKNTGIAVADAYLRAADVTFVDGNDPWQTQKLYIHQSVANGLGTEGRTFENWLIHDYWEDVTIDTTGNGVPDMTPRQVANLGLAEHVTQKKFDGTSRTVVTVYETGEQDDGHDSEYWGLYASTVGPDTLPSQFTLAGTVYNNGSNDGWARGDFFENVVETPEPGAGLLLVISLVSSGLCSRRWRSRK